MTTPEVHEIKPAAFYRDSSTESLRRWRDSGEPTYAEQMKIDQELGNRAHANRRRAINSLSRPDYLSHIDAYRSRCAEIRELDRQADAARAEY